MATVLEAYTTEEHSSVVRFFLWAKGLDARGIHKEMFPVYGGKGFSLKAVHIWFEKPGKGFADDEGVETEVRKWLRQQSKYFYAAGFDTQVKRWDTWRICREINVFSRFQNHMFYVLYPFVTNLLTPSY
jgi:hypothetical protein